jgi:plasmid replication initiation protein
VSDLILIDENQEVRKAEALVYSRYKLSSLALRLITSLISSVQRADAVDKVYQVEVKKFTELAELKGNAYYKELDRATDEILEKPIKINLGGKNWLKANWCSSIEYKDGEGIIEFQISPKLFPYILNLKEKYLKYDIKNILKLRSDYSIRLYEFLKDIYNREARYNRNAVVIYELDFLRNRLQIPNSYQFQHIKERVLDKAENNLLKHTDIKFTWEIASKVRKKVHSIKFKIYSNLRDTERNIKLPSYMQNFISFVNYLKKQYKNTEKYFLLIINKNVREGYLINNKNLVSKMDFNAGGMSKELEKDKAETILNYAYIVAKYSQLYREFIENADNLKDIYRNDKELFGILANDIKNALLQEDPRQKPLF